MNRKTLLSIILFLLAPIPLFANTLFNVEQNEDEMDILVVMDESTGKSFDGPSNQIITLVSIKDFDGDGNDDALISSSGGGNCCPEEYSIVTVKKDTLKVVPFEVQWSEISAVDENNAHFIQEKTTESTKIYAFDGEKLSLVKNIPKREALKEVYGPGGTSSSSEERQAEVLAFDINDDEIEETIICPVWERWGSLLCILPVPGKEDQQLSIGCDRFGVLASMNNGLHEFVCNNDIIITFDGSKWIEKSSCRLSR